MSDDTGGHALDRYRLVAKLGRGGMAEVYLAATQGAAGSTKLQVIKRLNEHLAQNEEFVRTFVEEARLAALLNHPNIAHIHDVGRDKGTGFIVMEYLDGQPLRNVIARGAQVGTPMPLALRLRVLADTLGALHYAHELCDLSGELLGVVHRDVSPHNIFLTHDGCTKLLDFGIARVFSSASETKSGVLRGKAAYMAPEQVQEGAEVDQRTDIFQVGIVLWEAITGCRYWSGQKDVAIVYKLVAGKLPSLREFALDLDPDLANICERALAVHPQDRFRTAEQFRLALEDFMGRRHIVASQAEIAEYLGQLFSDQRQSIRTRIHDRLLSLSTDFDGSSSMMNLSASGPLGIVADSVFPALSDSGMLSNVGFSASQLVLKGPDTSSASPPGKANQKSKTLMIALVGVVVLLAAAIGFFVRSPKTAPAGTATSSTAPIPTSPSVLAAAAATSTTEQRELIQLKLACTPETARLYLDGAPLSTNPFTGQFPKDGAVHHVRAEAPGLVPEALVVEFDRDRDITCALHVGGPLARPYRGPAPQAPAAVAQPTKTAEPEVPAAPSVTPKQGKQKVKLDDGDPWK